MKRLLSVPVVVALAASAVLVSAPVAGADPAPRGLYASLTPVRVLDTRTDGGGALGQGGTRTVDLPAEVPQTATAVVVNLTVDAPSAPGYLTVYPAGVERPVASSLNKRAGETRSNSVTVALPADGTRQLVVYNQQGTSQVVLDLFGYYDPTITGTNPGTFQGSEYHPFAAPRRLVDSRSGARFGPDSGVVVQLSMPEGSDLTGVGAVAVNVTAVDPTGPGYLTAWDGSLPKPNVSTVNYGYDAATPNFAVVPVAADENGTVSLTVANSVGTTDLLVDVFGVYSLGGSGGATYQPVVPQRLADTRTEGGPVGQQSTVTTLVPVANGDVAVAANLNVTGVDASVRTFLAAYPDDLNDPPVVSNLNPAPGQAVPNAVQTTLGTDDAGYRIYNSQGTIDVISDLQGYFVADAGDFDAPRPAVAPSEWTVHRF